VDISAIRGDTQLYRVTVVRNNAPVNLTGAKVWFTAKLDKNDADVDAVIAKDTDGSGVEITDPLLGKVSFSIVPADTASLDKDTTLWYDVQVRESDGTVSTVVSGLLRVVLDVTLSTA
jgi:hypothetical protein